MNHHMDLLTSISPFDLYLAIRTAVETENIHEAVAKIKLYKAVQGPIALITKSPIKRGSSAGDRYDMVNHHHTFSPK